jgi:ABC-type molybdenum transport system ATPase subunit/photorepair protein PhrA
VKYISVIAFVSGAGKSLIANIVTSQDSPSAREQLNKHGVRFGSEGS